MRPDNVAPPRQNPPKPALWTHDEAELLAKFPSKFTPRPAQIQVLKETAKAFQDGKRFVVVEAPTGAGKSAIAKAVCDAVADEGGAYMITAQRTLQDQYSNEWKPPEMEVLKGRANYGCSHPGATDSMNAGDAVCHVRKKGILLECVDDEAAGWDNYDEDGEPKGLLQAAVRLELPPEAHHCPYWKQLQKCNDSRLTLFNFSSFLFQRRIGRFQKRALLVVDEAHGCEGQLMNFVTLELTEWALSILNVEIDRQITTKAQFIEWLREKDVTKRLDDALGKNEKRAPIDADLGNDDDEESLTAELDKVEKDALTELKGKLENFLAYLGRTEWLLETVEYFAKGQKRRKIVARPLYVKDFADELLFQHADRVMLFSATILDVKLWAENLGIKLEDLHHIQTECEFPVENRTVHLEFAGNMGRRWFSPEQNPSDPTKPKFVAKVKQILKRHEGQRGIIHSHSFELAKVIREEIGDDRFLFQDDFSGDKQLMLSAHASREDSVIVAPAMHEGFDFKDDLGRFQIVAKIPWPSLGDRLMKERMSRHDRFYAWCCAIKLTQTLGRIVRGKSDWGYSYILDAGFTSFFSRYGDLVPGWVKEAFRKYPPKLPIRKDQVS